MADTHYTASQLPASDDPGWGSHWRHASGPPHRLIHVHGPFDLATNQGLLACESGYIGVDESGGLYVVEDEHYDRIFKGPV